MACSTPATVPGLVSIPAPTPRPIPNGLDWYEFPIDDDLVEPVAGAALRAGQTPGEWVAEALKTYLQRRGFAPATVVA
jgi:hypothetical protein